MKILHVIGDFSPRTGGTVTAVKGLAAAQRDLGHEVSVAATAQGWKKQYKLPGVNFHIYKGGASSWRYSKALSSGLEACVEKADIVHLHAIWEFPALCAARACIKIKKPFLVTAHGMLDRYSLSKGRLKKWLYLKTLGRPLLEQAEAVHFTSAAEMNGSQGFRRSKAFVAPFGLDKEFYSHVPAAASFSRRFPRLRGKEFVLFLGRVHPKKQPDLLIRAFANLPKFPDVKLVIAGPGDKAYLMRLRRLCTRLGVRERVVFIGMLREDAVKEALAAATVFVLPSLQENFGFSIVEAMAMGCPVVVSRSVNLSDAIESAGAGTSCELTPADLSQALSRLLSDEVLRKKMGQAGRELVVSRFRWEFVVNQILSAYRKIIS